MLPLCSEGISAPVCLTLQLPNHRCNVFEEILGRRHRVYVVDLVVRRLLMTRECERVCASFCALFDRHQEVDRYEIYEGSNLETKGGCAGMEHAMVRSRRGVAQSTCSAVWGRKQGLTPRSECRMLALRRLLALPRRPCRLEASCDLERVTLVRTWWAQHCMKSDHRLAWWRLCSGEDELFG
jgi:hypothetical protein